MVFAGHCEEFFGRFGRVFVDDGIAAGVDLRAQRIVSGLEIVRPLPLPVARQRRRAVEQSVQCVELVRDLVRGDAETGIGFGEIGLHVGPGQDHRPRFPGFADQFVVPLVHHACGIGVAAVDAEGFRIHQQLRPAAQTFGPEFEQRQTAQRSEQRALRRLQGKAGEWSDGFLMQEARGQSAQAGGAVVIERSDPRRVATHRIPNRRIEIGRRGPQALQESEHAAAEWPPVSGTCRAGSCASADLECEQNHRHRRPGWSPAWRQAWRVPEPVQVPPCAPWQTGPWRSRLPGRFRFRHWGSAFGRRARTRLRKRRSAAERGRVGP